MNALTRLLLAATVALLAGSARAQDYQKIPAGKGLAGAKPRTVRGKFTKPTSNNRTNLKFNRKSFCKLPRFRRLSIRHF